jgi:spore germination protein GerM
MKKWIYVLICLIFSLFIIFAIFKNTKNVEVETEVTEFVPEEEISDEQNRTTLLTLYFVDSSTGELFPEVKKIDVKEIINEPYEKIMNFLIEGSQTGENESTIPLGTKLNSIKLDGSNLIIDLSKEFIEKYEVNSEEQNKVIYSVVNTFLELKEISSVSFLIDGETVDNMSQPFVKIE